MTKTTCQPPEPACQIPDRVLGQRWGTGPTLPYLNLSVGICNCGTEVSSDHGHSCQPVENASWASPRWKGWNHFPHHSTSGAHAAFQGWPRGPGAQYPPEAVDIPAGSVTWALKMPGI